MGDATSQVYKRLACLLNKKHDLSYGEAVGWIAGDLLGPMQWISEAGFEGISEAGFCFSLPKLYLAIRFRAYLMEF